MADLEENINAFITYSYLSDNIIINSQYLYRVMLLTRPLYDDYHVNNGSIDDAVIDHDRSPTIWNTQPLQTLWATIACEEECKYFYYILIYQWRI